MVQIQNSNLPNTNLPTFVKMLEDFKQKLKVSKHSVSLPWALLLIKKWNHGVGWNLGKFN